MKLSEIVAVAVIGLLLWVVWRTMRNNREVMEMDQRFRYDTVSDMMKTDSQLDDLDF
ncbi:hypothetical protein GUITHDRAFT_156738 [Guillardia theta CCMP2712]|uniref:Uncharacterized protein n=1 Tax=Guillardia theta (strain CCMP2712) TaxID=905079 RepID=L1I3Q0_GUITC|nr:hypothetical protein GUITHDRAFT_156738 [Guillardia theta CCMP2712]EKX30836.1 hypothetical protein GUITHDRAFT_156738 [Guillardia theta CCMP2712]|eukprot:XP_005817816.1 hypothetical protein GUITHDRAFT_156738 [Guillardia theta CCMP2712]